MENWDIRKIVKNCGKYYAHTSSDEKQGRELLEEHAERTKKYFLLLWNEKNGDCVASQFLRTVVEDCSRECEDVLKNMIGAIAPFHDIGKTNPVFQREAMQNDCREPEQEIRACIQSDHSIISAIVYLDYMLKYIRSRIENKKEKKVLNTIALVHTYIIARHHSNLMDFPDFLDRLEHGIGNRVREILTKGEWQPLERPVVLQQNRIQYLCREYEEIWGDLKIPQNISMYIYTKFLYSLLLASDYWATSEFVNGHGIPFVEDRITEEWYRVYENTNIVKTIREYEKAEFPKNEAAWLREAEINILRTELFLEAENISKKNRDQTIYYLEAPTGSGKSNTAINLSLQMLKRDPDLKKIWYIYPFNTLVEQNLNTLREIFGEKEQIFENIAVINSLTPVKIRGRETDTNYERAWLDRQFLNYPMILSTHVSLFQTMFGSQKESAFGFFQLADSVVILDEIQSYKNTLWAEIIYFLKEFAKLLHMKIVIMSATLPDLDFLSGTAGAAVRLIRNREKYFEHPCFQNRVEISYELMNVSDIISVLKDRSLNDLAEGKKVLIEFINKNTAFEFYRQVKEQERERPIELLSGDDSIAERKRILERVKRAPKGILLISTQVAEAGLDIDMDIGYKNISKLDSEEQFMGRINRSCRKSGKVFFFCLDDAKTVYRDGDIRVNKELTLQAPEIMEILEKKRFPEYYEMVMKILRENLNESTGQQGLDSFFSREVGRLRFHKVQERMKLIQEDQLSVSVFLARTVKGADGKDIDGREVWKEYKSLLEDFSMGYAEKKVRLSKVRSQMSEFVYQIQWNPDLIYNDKIGQDQIGAMYYIEDGEKYFENGKLNRKKLQGKETFTDIV